MLVETTDFINEIALPIDIKDVKKTKLCAMIEQYEPEWLRYALGYGFYKLFEAALAGTPDTKWTNLRDGCDWTYNGETYRFNGVKRLIRRYVYYWYMRSEHTITTFQGEKKAKSENADNTSPGAKMCQQWDAMSRDMFDCEEGLYFFLENSGDYDDDFDISRCKLDHFRSINPLSI